MTEKKETSKLARVGMIVVMLGIMALILYPVAEFWLFRLDARTTEGIVLGTDEHVEYDSDSNSSTAFYFIDYRYTIDGENYISRGSVTSAMMDAVEKGDPITVYVDPEDPNIALLGHQRSTFIIWVVLLLGGGFIWAVGQSLRE